jgi:hypothetical protein
MLCCVLNINETVEAVEFFACGIVFILTDDTLHWSVLSVDSEYGFQKSAPVCDQPAWVVTSRPRTLHTHTHTHTIWVHIVSSLSHAARSSS